jgi:hypothetical protein
MTMPKPRARERQEQRREVYAAAANLPAPYVLEELARRFKVKNGSLLVRFRDGFMQDVTVTHRFERADIANLPVSHHPLLRALAEEKGTSESRRSRT